MMYNYENIVNGGNYQHVYINNRRINTSRYFILNHDEGLSFPPWSVILVAYVTKGWALKMMMSKRRKRSKLGSTYLLFLFPFILGKPCSIIPWCKKIKWFQHFLYKFEKLVLQNKCSYRNSVKLSKICDFRGM